MTNQFPPQQPRNERQAQRIRQQNTVMIAIAVTFVLLLLVFAILLCVNVVMSFRDDTDTPKDDPKQEENPPTEDPSEDTPPLNNTYTTTTVSSELIHSQGALLLVNSQNRYTFPSNVSLVNIYNRQETEGTRNQYFKLPGSGILMEETAYTQMNKMLMAFGDTTIHLTSAHRTYEQQEGKDIPAGYSDSHTGLSFALRGEKNGVPVDLDKDEKYAWLYEHCYEYGFVVRYPNSKSEITGVSNYSEYFRYVGYVHAYMMKNNNFCLEEYITYLQSHTYGEKALKVTTDNGSSYEIYYVAATGSQTEIPVPVAGYGQAEIWGDNIGGFIVTVKLP